MVNVIIFFSQQNKCLFLVFSGESIQLSESINRWSYTTIGWEGAIREILTADDLVPQKTTIQRPRDIFFPCMLNDKNLF